MNLACKDYLVLSHNAASFIVQLDAEELDMKVLLWHSQLEASGYSTTLPRMLLCHST
jgi:hypothetical protein